MCSTCWRSWTRWRRGRAGRDRPPVLRRRSREGAGAEDDDVGVAGRSGDRVHEDDGAALDERVDGHDGACVQAACTGATDARADGGAQRPAAQARGVRWSGSLCVRRSAGVPALGDMRGVHAAGDRGGVARSRSAARGCVVRRVLAASVRGCSRRQRGRRVGDDGRLAKHRCAGAETQAGGPRWRMGVGRRGSGAVAFGAFGLA
jgi:hypothetical protein